MVGAPPAHLPRGWPEVLELPRGGALVSASDAANLGYFLSFLFFFLRMVTIPLQPVFKMLTAAPSADAEPPADGAPSRYPQADPPPAAGGMASANGGAGTAESTENGFDAAISPGDDPDSIV